MKKDPQPALLFVGTMFNLTKRSDKAFTEAANSHSMNWRLVGIGIDGNAVCFPMMIFFRQINV